LLGDSIFGVIVGGLGIEDNIEETSTNEEVTASQLFN